MKQRKVISATAIESLGVPLSGETTLNQERQQGIELYTGIEPGFLTVLYRGQEMGVPIANIKSLIWEIEKK